MSEKLIEALQQHNSLLERSLALHAETLENAARLVAETFTAGGRLLVVASAALQDLARLLVVGFAHQLDVERPALPALGLGFDGSLVAALSEAEQFDQLSASQVQILARPEDCLLLLDCAAEPALLAAQQAARELGCRTLVLSLAEEGAWQLGGAELVISLQADSRSRGREVLLFHLQMLCELVEAELFGL